MSLNLNIALPIQESKRAKLISLCHVNPNDYPTVLSFKLFERMRFGRKRIPKDKKIPALKFQIKVIYIVVF